MHVTTNRPTAVFNAGASKVRGGVYWFGWALSGLVIAFLLIDAITKLMALPIVVDPGATLGFQGSGIARGLV